MRCYVPAEAWSNTGIELDPEESHHLLHVLRGRVGRDVELFDGCGRTARAEIEEVVNRKLVRVRVREETVVPQPPVSVTLIQALTREQKMDLIIQKAVELGVSCIVPTETEHSVVHLRASQVSTRRARWDKIALSAAKQCGAAWLPRIDAPRRLDQSLSDREPFALTLFCSLDADTLPLRDVIQTAKSTPPASMGVFVGPEGDFSALESAWIRDTGATAVTLGASVLRAETAALYILSVLRYEFGG